jgi:hypothetical protein
MVIPYTGLLVRDGARVTLQPLKSDFPACEDAAFSLFRKPGQRRHAREPTGIEEDQHGLRLWLEAKCCFGWFLTKEAGALTLIREPEADDQIKLFAERTKFSLLPRKLRD